MSEYRELFQLTQDIQDALAECRLELRKHQQIIAARTEERDRARDAESVVRKQLEFVVKEYQVMLAERDQAKKAYNMLLQKIQSGELQRRMEEVQRTS